MARAADIDNPFDSGGWYEDPYNQWEEDPWQDPPPPDEPQQLTPEPAPVPAPGPAPSPTPTPTPTPTYSGGGGGGGGDGISLSQPYSRDSFNNAWTNAVTMLGPAPKFSAPEIPQIDPFTYDPWAAPAFEDIYKDGSYQGRKREGEQALLNSKAAQGLVRTGHSLKDLLTYNQDFAGREYGNIFDRSLSAYHTNRGNAFDNWRTNAANTLTRAGMEQDRAWNQFQPQLVEWQTKGGLGQRGAEFDANLYRASQSDLFDRLRWLSEFELDAATR